MPLPPRTSSHAPALLLFLGMGAPSCRPPAVQADPQREPADTAAPADTDPPEAVPGATGDPGFREPPLCHVTVTCDGEIPDDPKIPCHLQVEEASGRVLYDGTAGFERRGRSSVYFPKPQYAVELWEAPPEGDQPAVPTTANFFGMGGEDDWILNGAYVDRALVRNKLVFDLFQALGGPGRYAPEQVFCDLTLDGAWQGIYLLGERVDRDDDRLDLAEDPERPGASFVIKNDDAAGGFLGATVTTGSWFLVWPDRLDDEDLARVTAVVDGWQAAVLGPEPADPERGIFAWLDADSAADWWLIQEFAKNNDAYHLSVHLWQDLDGRMHFAPWDLDLSFGYPYTDCGWEGWIASRSPMITAMEAMPEFRVRLRERWAELRDDALATEHVLARLDTYREVMGDTVHANFETWPFGEIQFCWGGICWLCPVEDFDAEWARLREWIEERLRWMDAHVGELPGG